MMYFWCVLCMHYIFSLRCCMMETWKFQHTHIHTYIAHGWVRHIQRGEVKRSAGRLADGGMCLPNFFSFFFYVCRCRMRRQLCFGKRLVELSPYIHPSNVNCRRRTVMRPVRDSIEICNRYVYIKCLWPLHHSKHTWLHFAVGTHTNGSRDAHSHGNI